MNIASWVKNAGDRRTEPFPYVPELVGQSGPTIVLGKGSGLDSVAIWMDRLALEWTDSKELEAILAEVKATSLEKRELLDEDEFIGIVQKVLPGAEG